MPALQPQRRYETRDKDGLLILTNLESMRKYVDPSYCENACSEDSYCYEDEDDTLLFNRNWAITEPRTGRSFKEFVNYDKL